MYLLALTFSFCITYLILFILLPLFFENRVGRLNLKSLTSIGVIVALSFFGYFVAFAIPDQELSNRFLHAFGGGFLGFFTCFLAAKDSSVVINKFQFFIFSVLVVVALGVANEILEFILQNYTGMIFATSVNDTWLDLVSNIVGLLVASVIFVPLVHSKKF